MTMCARVCVIMAGLLAATAVSAERLPGSAWAPTEINGDAFAPLQETFLQFDSDGKYFGKGGCNTFRGRFVTNEDAILLSPAAATMMACPDAVMAQEFAFFQALMAVRQFERADDSLILTNGAGEVLLVMMRRDAE